MTEHEIPNCNMTEPPLPPEGMRPKSRAQLRSWIVKTVLMLALIAFSIVLMFSIGIPALQYRISRFLPWHSGSRRSGSYHGW